MKLNLSILITILSIYSIGCKSQSKNNLYVLLNMNNEDKVSWSYSESSEKYTGFATLNKGNHLYLTEPGKKDLHFTKKRFKIDKDSVKLLSNTMTEEEFCVFAKHGGVIWGGTCSGCSWGPYHEVYMIIMDDTKEKYQVFRLASIIIEFD